MHFKVFINESLLAIENTDEVLFIFALMISNNEFINIEFDEFRKINAKTSISPN